MVPEIPSCPNCKRPATVYHRWKGSDRRVPSCGACNEGAPDYSEPIAPPSVEIGDKMLVSREEAAQLLGGISLDTFDRHVRHKVKAQMVGSRPMYSVDALRAFAASGSKSLS